MFLFRKFNVMLCFICLPLLQLCNCIPNIDNVRLFMPYHKAWLVIKKGRSFYVNLYVINCYGEEVVSVLTKIVTKQLFYMLDIIEFGIHSLLFCS